MGEHCSLARINLSRVLAAEDEEAEIFPFFFLVPVSMKLGTAAGLRITEVFILPKYMPLRCDHGASTNFSKLPANPAKIGQVRMPKIWSFSVDFLNYVLHVCISR